MEIEYCTGCRWMLRAAWMQQELLVTFEQELESVSLKPGRDGVFDIRVDGDRIWSRADDGGFPDIKDLKQRVRDRVNPDRSLGHTDRAHGA